MPEAELDLSAIEAEVQSMNQEDLVAELVKSRARQRAQTKKYYNPDAAKKARQKRAAKLKAMADAIKQLGLEDQVNRLVDEKVEELTSGDEEAA